MIQRKKASVKKDSALSRVLAQRTGDWLLAGVDDYLERSGEYRSDPGWFHPSALSHQCDAFLAFAYLGIEGKGKMRARTYRILDNGTSRDEDWKRYLHESGLSILEHWGGSPEERKLASVERYIEIPHVHVRGECDDIVYNKLTRETYIHEFKTMNTEEWNKLRGPLSAHVVQVHAYMFARGILQSIITYENKNTQEVKQYVVKFNGNIWRSVEARLINIMDLVQNKQLPWRTPIQNDTQCQFYHGCANFSFKEE